MIVSSEKTFLKEELDHIKDVMVQNGYPESFVKKTIDNKMKRGSRAQGNQNNGTAEGERLETANIPFIDGLSQEIRRIARSVDVRCAFSMPDTTRPLYSVKDQLPLVSTTHAVYSLTCGTCKQEYIGETLRAVWVRCKEHRSVICNANDKASAVAEHVLSSKNENPHEIWRFFFTAEKSEEPWFLLK